MVLILQACTAHELWRHGSPTEMLRDVSDSVEVQAETCCRDRAVIESHC
jgi:hypothetical protein